MTKIKTHYHILQVQPDADQEVVDAAYRRLCKKHHPDLNPGFESEVHIRLLNDAYHVLGDPIKRTAYDQHLKRTSGPSLAKGDQTMKANANTAETTDERLVDSAKILLAQYFEALKEKQVYKAYQLLSDEDRSRITAQDFLDWQEAVGELFQIGDTQLSVFRTHRQMGVVSEVEFVAEGMEIDLVRNAITEFKTVKSVLWNGKRWQVVLGYEEVKGLAAKFRLLAQSRHTRLLDDEALQVVLEQEMYRANRFGDAFSLVLLKLTQMQESDAIGMWEAKTFSWVSDAVNHMRMTDMLSHRGHCTFLLLLPHTDEQQAGIAANKLKNLLVAKASEEGSMVEIQTLVSPYRQQQPQLWVTQIEKEL